MSATKATQTRQDVEKRVDQLAVWIADHIKQEARRLLRSGAVDLEENADRPMWLPKMLVTVAAETAARDYWNSVDREWVKGVANLRNF